MQTTKYASVLPKISAERSKFLSETKIKTLCESKNLTDLASVLRDSPYQEQISRILTPLTGRKLEHAFNENLIGTYLKIIKYSPPRAVRYIDLYLKRLETENVKTLIRAANAKLPLEQRLGRIYLSVERYFDRVGLMEEAAKATNLSQVVAVFKDTEYGEALALGLKSYERTGSATVIDIFADTLFYEQLYEVYSHLPRREKPHAAFYAAVWNDSFVQLTLLRGKNLNYDSNLLRLAIPKETFKLTKKDVESMILASSFSAALKIVQTSYYADFFNPIETPEETMAKAERAFQQALLVHAKKTQVKETFNIASTLSFITQKEAEVHNLVVAVLGVEAGMNSEVILNQLWL
jgi:vacuolar-type H+-ATPase subunit C/Vma6